MTGKMTAKIWNKDDIIILDDEGLKSYQTAILEMTKDIVAMMDENGIEYSLSGGSILGAIRHEGFIPWDDDIDLNIPRKDYNKLLAIFDEKLGDKYYLQTPQKNPELGLMVTQIRKKNTVARRKYDWNSTGECGISIDFYVIENVYDNMVARFVQKNMSMALSFVVSSIREVQNRGIPKEIQEAEGRVWKYSKGKLIVGSIARVIPMSKWIAWTEGWYQKCKSERTELVAIPSGRKHFSGEIYKRSQMCIFKKAPFEDTQFNIPVWAKGYLTRFYGDYMQIPPVEKRERHIFLELKY